MIPNAEVVSFDAAGVFGGIINENKKPGEGFVISDPNHEFFYNRKTVQTQVLYENYFSKEIHVETCFDSS
jgi:hypothetical protein